MMHSTKHTIRFISIVIALSIITIMVIIISYDFFLDVDYRTNSSIVVNTKENGIVFDKSDTREYKIIYDDSQEHSASLKDSFARVFEITKVNYSEFEKADNVSFSKDDFIIITLTDWLGSENIIESALEAAYEGASLLVAYAPVYDDYFRAKADILSFEVTDHIWDEIYTEGYEVVDDVLLGMKFGEIYKDASINDYIFDIELKGNAKVYLKAIDGTPMYYTNKYGEGCIGVYNGQNIVERYMDGMLLGLLGTLGNDYIYPIANSGLMFIDDWPAPFRGENDVIREQYGMDVDEFMRYIWWPDMLALAKQYGMVYMGQYILTYTDIIHEPFIVDGIEFDTNMYAFGQQIIKYGGELGLHGYNHQPLRYSGYSEESGLDYKKWDSYDESVTALQTAIDVIKESFPDYEMHSYVPPSNVMDEEGIEAVKEVLGEPVVISGMYNGDKVSYVDSQEVEYKDGVIYLPRFSSGSFPDDCTLNNIALGVSMYGLVSHFIHPDDVMDEERNKGYTWEEMRIEYSKLMDFIGERYPFIEYETATEAGSKVMEWYNQDYIIDYADDYIRVRTKYESESISMILKTEKQIIESEDYEVMKVGNLSYYINLHKSDVIILLQED